eukprot:1260157-Rhodomonas_salina.2
MLARTLLPPATRGSDFSSFPSLRWPCPAAKLPGTPRNMRQYRAFRSDCIGQYPGHSIGVASGYSGDARIFHSNCVGCYLVGAALARILAAACPLPLAPGPAIWFSTAHRIPHTRHAFNDTARQYRTRRSTLYALSVPA